MDTKSNNFGALRLLFASLVILSHSPELIDGDESRELLTNLLGTMSFGSLAVNGFFLISGYLITSSFYNSATTKSYLLKRILRIYPAFIVASLVCIFIFAPLSGGWGLISNLSMKDWIKIPAKLFILASPWVEGAFEGTKTPALNGSMWTIQYEFLCYLSIPLLFALGVKRIFYLYLTILLVIVAILMNIGFDVRLPFGFSAYLLTRFYIAFAVGSCFYQFRDLIAWKKEITLICALVLLAAMTNNHTAELGFFIFGGYLLFNFAFNFKNKFLNSIGTKNDISYGVYLYAWPFQNLVIQYHPNINPWILTLYALVFSIIMGFVSWKLVERPFMEMKRFFK